jgi:NAD(P)-dependent dehydrogenase (short-subunit alcohol dehydrogenase family)
LFHEKVKQQDRRHIRQRRDRRRSRQSLRRIDISFNATGLSQIGIQGIPLAQLSEEAFLTPINTYLKTYFITAKAAAARMIKQKGGGVILMHTPNASHISPPFVGGMVPAWSAIEGLCRSLSVEYGQQGLRSVCLLTAGMII